MPVKAAHNGEIRCRGSAAEAADAVVADREAADAVVADIDRDEAAVDQPPACLPAARSQSALSIGAGANPAISASGGSCSA